MYTLVFSRQATRALARMPSNHARLIRAKLDDLAADPHRMSNVKRLSGLPGYRLRVGDWRVLYLLEEGELRVVVVKIDTRGGVYK